MSIVNAISGNPIKNNTGTYSGPGSVLTTGNLQQSEQSKQNAGPDKVVEESASVGTMKALSVGEFCYQEPGKYIIRGGNSTTSLAGYDTTVGTSAASGGARESIHWMETRKTAIKTDWDMVTQKPDTITISDDDFGTDDAAHPTRLVPGEYTYSISGEPQTGEYNPTVGA